MTATPPNTRSVAGLQASRRSAVPSFIVMDVMQAAAAREALVDQWNEAFSHAAIVAQELTPGHFGVGFLDAARAVHFDANP